MPGYQRLQTKQRSIGTSSRGYRKYTPVTTIILTLLKSIADPGEVHVVHTNLVEVHIPYNSQGEYTPVTTIILTLLKSIADPVTTIILTLLKSIADTGEVHVVHTNLVEVHIPYNSQWGYHTLGVQYVYLHVTPVSHLIYCAYTCTCI